ncbi:MAG: hypothetical protein ACHQFW_02280 [Chitinophagales bacterium]
MRTTLIIFISVLLLIPQITKAQFIVSGGMTNGLAISSVSYPAYEDIPNKVFTGLYGEIGYEGISGDITLKLGTSIPRNYSVTYDDVDWDGTITNVTQETRVGMNTLGLSGRYLIVGGNGSDFIFHIVSGIEMAWFPVTEEYITADGSEEVKQIINAIRGAGGLGFQIEVQNFYVVTDLLYKYPFLSFTDIFTVGAEVPDSPFFCANIGIKFYLDEIFGNKTEDNYIRE